MDAGDGNPNIWANVCSDEESYYRIESWYPEIKEFTFDTNIIPLTLKEAMAIKRYKEMSKMIMSNNDVEKYGRIIGQWTDEHFLEYDGRIKESLEPDQITMLQNLQKKIDDAIQPYLAKGNSAFIKLSTRSPKDSAFFSTKMREMLKRDIEASKFTGGTIEADVEDVIVYVRASVRCLAVQSGAEALQLLIRSKRVHDDITMAELMLNSSGKFFLTLVVREWSPHVLPEWEFRVFVIGGKLTAATQYGSIVFVPGMAEKREGIKSLIKTFVDKVRDQIHCASYTIDLALNPDLDISRVQIVEINGPPPTAGTSLFDWNDLHERKLIMQGDDENHDGDGFTLKILEHPVPNVKMEFHPPLRKYMDELRGLPPSKEDDIFNHKHYSCDSCHRHPISQTFYHCVTCNKYDLCEDCHSKNRQSQHEKGHVLSQKGENKEVEAKGGRECSIM